MRALDAARPTATGRGYDAEWRRLRVEILVRDPVCKLCHVRPSEHVDHRVPLAAGGTTDPDNLQALCAPCHRRKTVREDGGFGRPRRVHA
jgi:5-methylcytosine-specific restriction protein A